MKTRHMVAAAFLAAASAQAGHSVGLGPLTDEGVTRTENKGFYLTVINPYEQAERFRLYGVGWDNEVPDIDVAIPVSEVAVPAKSQRRVLVVSTNMEAGEEHRFRVCAEKAKNDKELVINARVCSKLVARRIG